MTERTRCTAGVKPFSMMVGFTTVLVTRCVRDGRHVIRDPELGEGTLCDEHLAAYEELKRLAS